MTEQQEQFPFEQFIGALQQNGNLKKQLKSILKEISQQNIFWTYSSISTIIEILKGKEEQPQIKCRSLDAAFIMLELCQYSIITFFQVYLLPVLHQIALFKGRKSQELTSFYFQQTHGKQDCQQIRKLSLNYVQKAVQLIYAASQIKPYRTVQTDQIKQQSGFVISTMQLKQKGIEQPKIPIYFNQNLLKQLRKKFLDKLIKFTDNFELWTQFLLINLLQQIKSNKKQLLQLRLMLSYGQSYLTSAIINLCQEQLLQLNDNFEMKKKYLGILNQLVRYADIQAIIMIKNGQFLPSIVAHISKLQGNIGLQIGQNIYPQIKVSKQIKKQFYCDFLRCLETWAICMPQDYDSQQFSLKSLYKLLKEDRKFKFPQNIHINRFQKQIQQNLLKNKLRNDKLIELLENIEESKQTENKISKMSNVLQRTTLLPPSQLENRVEQAKRAFKDLIIQQTVQKSYKILLSFKQNWITYLQALDLQSADQGKLQNLIFSGQKCVQEIQLITPIYISYSKGKINFRDFKSRMKQVLDLHNQVSASISHNNKSKSINKSKQLIASKLAKSKLGASKLGASKLGGSKFGGKQLLDKIKGKSKFTDSSQLDLSKIIDRSQLLNKSKAQIQKIKLDVSNLNNNQNNNIKNNQNISQFEYKNKKQKNISKYQYQQQKIKNIQIIHHNKQQNQNNEIKKQNINNNIQQQNNININTIQDYQTIQNKNIFKNQNKRHLSRQKNSSILSRRSHKNSRIQKSNESHGQQRKSIKNNKKIKQTSLFTKTQKQIKSATQQQFFKDKIQINQTIQLNGNIIKQSLPIQQSNKKLNQQNSFHKFKDGSDSISSIHSNSVYKAFHTSADKILDLTQQNVSQVKISKKYIKTQVVQYSNKDTYIPPIVGDYYQQEIKKQLTPQLTPKKNQQKLNIKDLQLQQIHKNYFNQKQIQITRQNYKIKDSIINNKQIIKTSQINKNNLNKIQKTVKNDKKLNVVQVINLNQYNQPIKNDVNKDKEIASLQQKIRQLQKQTMLMKTKLAAKDNQIRSIKSSSKYGSQRGYPQFTTLSQSHADKSQRTSLRGSSVGKKVQLTRFQKQIQSQFKQYLQRIKGSTFRKSLLKLKCLVHKTDQIQIGCMSQRSDKNLQCTLYITPHRYNLIDFSMAIIHDHCIRTKVVPDQIKLITAKKQQKIHLTIQIIKIPFCLPQIQINYKSDSQYSSNYNRLTLPLCFSKFCQIKPISINQKQQKQLQYIRSDNFKLNNKIMKLDKLNETFPNFTILPPKQNRQQILATAQCRYLDSTFSILLNLSQKKCWIEGFLKKGQIKPMNFLICTYKQLLDGSKK